jgi:hypothetical protein
MTANMFQGSQQIVGENPQGHLPGSFKALKQGSEGETMSDLQFMLNNEKKQHQQRYNYEFGNTEMGQ